MFDWVVVSKIMFEWVAVSEKESQKKAYHLYLDMYSCNKDTQLSDLRSRLQI